MSPCGCNSASCGCTILAGPGIHVQVMSATSMRVSAAATVQTESDSAIIDPGTTHLVYNGGPAETLTAPAALEGRGFEVWNTGDDVTLEAAAGQTINGAASELVPAGYTATVISPADGEWLANVH